MRRIVLVAGLCVLPVCLSAQWLNVRTTDIPRMPDGKPNLTAPAPLRDGKPDLSGLWRIPGGSYGWTLIHDIKDETVFFKPAAVALFRKRAAEYDIDGPTKRCLPLGPAEILVDVFRIMQSPATMALLYNGLGDYRQIFLDGRALPKDPNPTWRGYSVGHWEGDTLVVETVGFNDLGWMDRIGHPRSERLRVTERFRRIDFGHMEFQITFDDPETLNRPLSISLPATYWPDRELEESVCNENEHDSTHMVGKLSDGVKLSTATLAKYVGTYGQITISLVDDRLYLFDMPLFPQSETTFDSRWAGVEFNLNADGTVKSLTRTGAVGDTQRFDRHR
jgi:hypothetical protein